MKFAAVFAFVLVLGTAAAVNNNWGIIGSQDRLLHREIIQKDSKFLRIVTEDYKWPPAGTFNYINITGIKAIDQIQDGNGGYATLLNGGVGSTTVTLHLKSKRNHEFNFIIEIYGR